MEKYENFSYGYPSYLKLRHLKVSEVKASEAYLQVTTSTWPGFHSQHLSVWQGSDRPSKFCGFLWVCLFVLRFYGPVNPMGSCRAQSVYLTTCLLGRLSPLSG